jgi:hypothetical protein
MLELKAALALLVEAAAAAEVLLLALIKALEANQVCLGQLVILETLD